jgi:hypothetical protein
MVALPLLRAALLWAADLPGFAFSRFREAMAGHLS